MCRTLLIIIFFLFESSILLIAQEKAQLRAVVLEAGTQAPLVGIQIDLTNNQQSTISNEQGQFLFVNLDAGSEQLSIRAAGYRPFQMNLIIQEGETLRLDTIELVPEPKVDYQMLLGVIDEDVLGEADISNQEVQSSVILSNDIYLNKVGFKLSPFRYRVRGYDPIYEQTFINGVLANDQYRRVFNYASIGALNDLTRNGDVVNYNNAGTFTFGSIGGSENINMRAGSYAPGARVTLSYTNRNYYARSILSYATGMSDRGWAFVGALGGRFSDRGYIEGTSYENVSYALSVERQWDEGRHSIALVTYGSPVVRGQQGSSFQEAYDLTKNNLYNPNWGYQNGKVRNSRIVKAYDPTVILSHVWRVDDRTSLSSGAMLHYGRYSNSALNWYDAMDPRPDYYRKLPSYQLLDSTRASLDISGLKNRWTSGDSRTTQIDWDDLYAQNRNPEHRRKYGGEALYMVERRHFDLLEGTMNANFHKLYDNNMSITAGVEARKSTSFQYKTVNDLLGADFVTDYDKFAEREKEYSDFETRKQNDLVFPDRKVYVGDIFGYDFEIGIQSASIWFNNQHKTKSFDFYYGSKFSYTDFRRSGRMKNGRFPNSSYGKGRKHQFFDFALKGGINYKFSGRHFLSMNLGLLTEAPVPDRAYIMSRSTDQTALNLKSARIFQSDLNYIFSTPKIAGRISFFQTNFNDQVERTQYYHDSERTFVFHQLSGVSKVHRGVEGAATFTPDRHWSIDAILNLGEYYYSGNPMGTMNSENGKLVNVQEKVYLKNVYVSGTPQFAGILAARYFYDFWFFEISGNYAGRMYLSAAPLRRIASNYANINPNDPQNYKAYLQLSAQERLTDAITFDGSIGKLLYLKNRKSLSVNFSIVNFMNDKSIRTGGFEQGRLSTKWPNQFAPRYFYMQGLNVFLNTSYRF